MRIAVYSGSFNPLHIGHQAIMEYLTRDGAFDWVYLVVSPQSPFKGAENALTGRERYEAAVEAVKRHPEIRVWVDDIELGMEPPHYTIRTLDALRAREPENDFTLVIGADNLETFPRWRDHARILKEYGVDTTAARHIDAANSLTVDIHRIMQFIAPKQAVHHTFNPAVLAPFRIEFWKKTIGKTMVGTSRQLAERLDVVFAKIPLSQLDILKFTVLHVFVRLIHSSFIFKITDSLAFRPISCEKEAPEMESSMFPDAETVRRKRRFESRERELS